ncbi:MAG: DUF6777 domain-containing protein [Actinomycetota bacterium]
MVIVLLVVLVLVVGGIAVVFATGGDEASATEYEREPVETAGDNPFMPNVGTDQPDVTPPADTGASFEGNTPGLYGGTMSTGSCDAEQLVTFLEANPDKGAAWARVVGIQTTEIRDFVSRLTPVVLRSDTYVTNHGFESGRATSFPAVLQAGTAVLVDDKGAPVVKCYCGNPLTAPPDPGKARYSGPRWPAFEPTNITVIQTTTVVIEIFTLVDVTTGAVFGRPAGTDGTQDGPAPETPEAPETPDTSTGTTLAPVPTNATYNITLAGSGGGACQPFSSTTTASVAGGQVTIQATQPLTGALSPDGTFVIDAAVNNVTTHIEGRLDAETLTATATEGDCTYTINGTRSA